MKMGDLAKRTGYSIAHLRRLAVAGAIPGRYKRVGKHFRFKRSEKLEKWITDRALDHYLKFPSPDVPFEPGERRHFYQLMKIEKLTPTERRLSLAAGDIVHTKRGKGIRKRWGLRVKFALGLG